MTRATVAVWIRRFGSSGSDAPICQDGRSGGFPELLARAEVSHDALIDFPSEKAFKASDDVPFRPSIHPASDDIVDRRLVIAHTDYDGSMEGGVRLSVAAPIEAVSTGGHPGGGGDGTRAAELGKGGFRANPLRVIPERPAERLREHGVRHGWSAFHDRVAAEYPQCRK